ncbi:MAG: hypothetical protein M1383_06260 [Patescibacteria group bacterium]|nr:hypothetical protein [Patescibacteria group bacterium]
MAAFNKFNAFVEAVAEKVHNLGSDTLKVALTNSAPVATNAVLADITEISYTNISDRTVTVSSSAQTSGTYKLVCADLVLTATGAVGPFRYVVLYNDTPAGKNLIGWWDYGSAITLASGNTFTVDFDGTNGVLQLA